MTSGKLTDTGGINVAWSKLVGDLNVTRIRTFHPATVPDGTPRAISISGVATAL